MVLGGRPQVTAFSSDSVSLAKTYVDGQCNFVLALYSPTPVRLQVDIQGVTSWMGAENFSDATVYEPEAGRTLVVDPYIESGINCRLSGPGADTDHHARFLLIDSSGNAVTPSDFGDDLYYQTNPIIIPNLAPGTYFLHVERASDTQRWLPQWFDRADDLAQATPIEIQDAGEVIELTLDLVAGGAIQGRIQRSNGAPFGGWHVSVYAASDSNVVFAWVETGDMTGAFRAVGLPDGGYKLSLNHLGPGLRWWFPGTLRWDGAEVVTIESHSEVIGVEWQIPE
jgi:hypothetical protein